MSQQQWQPPSRSPGGAGGSVRRARQRVEAGLPPEIPQPPQEKPYEPPRSAMPNPPPSKIRPPMPAALVGSKGGQAPIGVAISRPTQVPQWPLAGTVGGGQDARIQQYQPPAGRGPPPQRPPRPSQVPSILDASRLQEHTPAFQYTPQNPQDRTYDSERYEEEDMMSPMSMSSRPSTLSSVGSIPDFPVPMPPPGPPGPPRRSANLGPPPTSRRGASSYYSQASFVSPIPEESPRTQTTHLSYASSAAIPTSWGSDSPRYPYDEDDYEDEDVYEHERRFEHPPIEEGRESRGSDGDDNDDRGLIRSASFGRRAKPSMITTRSSDKTEPQRPAPMPRQIPQQLIKLQKMGVAGGAAGTPLPASSKDTQRDAVWPIIGDVNSPLATGTGLIDKSTSSSEEAVPTVARAITTNEAAPAYTASSTDSNAMLGAYNAASSLQPPGLIPTRTPSPGFSRLSAVRRPPRLNMDAVRDAEARGSLTSLPDLIRRATRLAAMMERGKRPSSRLALNDFPSSSDLAREKEISESTDEKHRSGLSGMLAAFPPPGVATPRGDNTPTRPISAWPSQYDLGAGVGQNDERKKKRRRCCGLPCWGFILVVLILLIIIAAAVVVPLELLVINKPKSNTPKASAIEQCQTNTATACQNGGSSLIDNGSCACICTNGFTGSTCTNGNATGCTTVTLSGSSFTNVTLGDAISRLISGAQTNFSVPLSEGTILARFNSANLSCATENALVTFDGQSQRDGAASDLINPASTTSDTSATPQNRRRQDGTPTSSSSEAAATQNGIVYDSSAPTATPSPSSSTSPSSTDPLGVFSVTEEVLDFARVAVLYVLQQDQLENAINAQSQLQNFFKQESFTNMAAANISLGNGNVANLLTFAIDVGNGSVGAKNVSLVGKRTDMRRRSRRSVELWGVL